MIETATPPPGIKPNHTHPSHNQSMEILCTIPTWPSYATTVDVCNDFNLDVDTLHQLIRGLRENGMLIHRVAGRHGETLSILFNNAFKVDVECTKYWKTVYE